jgi:hypothetical protein
MLAACGILLWRSPATAAPAHSATDAPPTWKDAAFWVALAAVPAGLLVAVQSGGLTRSVAKTDRAVEAWYHCSIA